MSRALILILVATSTPSGVYLSRSRAINASDTSSNSTLSTRPLGPPRLPPPRPMGPDSFEVTLQFGARPFQWASCLMSATHVVANIAVGGFYRALPAHKTVFQDQRIPHIAITVSSAAPNLRIQRRFVLWGLARIANAMVVERRFFGVTATLYDRGRRIGMIEVEDSTRLPLLANFVDKMSNTSQSSTISSTVSYSFAFYGDLLPMEDVFMGTIGTLNAAAQDRSTVTTDFFIGSFPWYRAFYVWGQVGPRRMSYELIIGATLAAATHAYEKNDYRELRVVARDGAEVVMEGGYLKALPGGSDHGLDATAAS